MQSSGSTWQLPVWQVSWKGRPVIMISLMQQASVMIESTHVVGFFELERWNVHHHSCADFIWPFRQQLLESETAFCSICCKNCISVVDFILRHEWVHLCLPLFVCPVCHFTYINPILFTNAHHWISWRSKLSSAISFFSIIISRI